MKYEKFLQENENAKVKVIQIIDILDGETVEFAKVILSAADYFLKKAATVDAANLEVEE